ncbi:hypothetical protein ACKWTF_013892 [Chironomus riparius]
MLYFMIFTLISTLNLLRVESHVVLSISEMNPETDNFKFNEFIDNPDKSQANNFEPHHNETSDDLENPQETSSPTIVTTHDEFTVIHVAEHHKKEPSRIKDFPLSEFHKEESSTVPSENDHQKATAESTSTFLESEKAIETETMKTERESTAREQIGKISTAKNSEQIKINQTETFPTIVSTTNKTSSTIKPKPTPSNATSLKISFIIFLMAFYACCL